MFGGRVAAEIVCGARAVAGWHSRARGALRRVARDQRHKLRKLDEIVGLAAQFV